jgi:hypothetical protein
MNDIDADMTIAAGLRRVSRAHHTGRVSGLLEAAKIVEAFTDDDNRIAVASAPYEAILRRVTEMINEAVD